MTDTASTSSATTTPNVVIDQDLLRQYAADIAFVAEAEQPATDLVTLARHLETAASNFDTAGITGHEDIDSASNYVHDAHLAGDSPDRHVFLRKADELLYPYVYDMTQEYRCMVA